ncbi:MAG: hypothetical protein HY079_08815 [Elusimicrobia bacterium]|nr:hypothetical protein [Elusimicrobiota bacterium]
MKVRCIANTGKNLSENNLRRGFSRNSEFPLTVGQEYPVYGMCVFEGALSFLVFDDSRRPNWAPVEIFTVVDGRVPSDWSFTSWDSTLSGVWGYKELVSSREYFDRLAEHSEPAILDFHRQRERIDRAAKDAED